MRCCRGLFVCGARGLLGVDGGFRRGQGLLFAAIVVRFEEADQFGCRLLRALNQLPFVLIELWAWTRKRSSCSRNISTARRASSRATPTPSRTISLNFKLE